MNFFFGKKQTVYAIAEVLENGRSIFEQEMKKLKYQGEHSGPEPVIEIGVRVQPENEPGFESKMKAGISKYYLLMPGVRVQVKYEPNKMQSVLLDDNLQDIMARNPQLIKKE